MYIPIIKVHMSNAGALRYPTGNIRNYLAHSYDSVKLKNLLPQSSFKGRGDLNLLLDNFEKYCSDKLFWSSELG